jgi:hypothetical protein
MERAEAHLGRMAANYSALLEQIQPMEPESFPAVEMRPKREMEASICEFSILIKKI